jgi:hypothetical protein
MPSRKKSQGRARKAAKAEKQQQEAVAKEEAAALQRQQQRDEEEEKESRDLVTQRLMLSEEDFKQQRDEDQEEEEYLDSLILRLQSQQLDNYMRQQEEAEANQQDDDDNDDDSIDALIQRVAMENEEACNEEVECFHGYDPIPEGHVLEKFIVAFEREFHKSVSSGGDGFDDALKATKEKYPQVWSDSTQLEWLVSFYYARGTQNILDGKNEMARWVANLAYFFEQIVATVQLFHKSQATQWRKTPRAVLL